MIIVVDKWYMKYLVCDGLSNNELVGLMDNYYNQIQEVETSRQRRSIFDSMNYLYETYDFIRDLWEKVETRLLKNRFVRKIKRAVWGEIEWNGFESLPDDTEQFYCIRLLKDEDLVYSKVGTTTRKTSKRMREHLRYYKKDGINHLIVDRLVDCKGLPAEGLESMVRSYYIKKWGKKFRKNDRFVGVEFDYSEVDELTEKYLE